MWNLEAGVANFTSLLTEDCAQQALFWCQFGFTLRSDFSNEHITRTNFGAYANDSAVVEVGKDVVAQVWNVASDFFWSKLGVTSVNFVFLDVN